MYRIAFAIAIFLLSVSCGATRKIFYKIEESHTALYKQKVLLVYAVETNKVLLTNPASTRCYFLKGKQYTEKWAAGDTLFIDNNMEDFYSLKFERKCKFSVF
jgi:cytochrome c peroxidase